jgi:hypothetical protein
MKFDVLAIGSINRKHHYKLIEAFGIEIFSCLCIKTPEIPILLSENYRSESKLQSNLQVPASADGNRMQIPADDRYL